MYKALTNSERKVCAHTKQAFLDTKAQCAAHMTCLSRRSGNAGRQACCPDTLACMLQGFPVCGCTFAAHAIPREIQHLGCNVKVRRTTGNIPGHGKPVSPALRCRCCPKRPPSHRLVPSHHERLLPEKGRFSRSVWTNVGHFCLIGPRSNYSDG